MNLLITEEEKDISLPSLSVDPVDAVHTSGLHDGQIL